MVNCYYCGKKVPGFGGKRFPAHPKDVGLDYSTFSCGECWQTRVAGIGLTVATGDKEVDVARMKEYHENAKSFKKSGDTLAALDNYEKFVELSLKCLGYKPSARGGEWVDGFDLDSMGDLYVAAGNIQRARESYQLAIKLLKETPTDVKPSILYGVLEGIQLAGRKNMIKQIGIKLGTLSHMPPAPTQRKNCMYCGASIGIDAAYCTQCGKQQ